MEYNILEISLDNYLIHHWKRTKDAVRTLRMNTDEFKEIWVPKYYKEKCEALEKELTKVKVTVLKEKLDEM